MSIHGGTTSFLPLCHFKGSCTVTTQIESLIGHNHFTINKHIQEIDVRTQINTHLQ